MNKSVKSVEPLISTLSGDDDMVDLVEMFVDELPDRVASLQSAFDAAQSTEVKRIAHQLKGAAGGYGFDSITQAAAALEKLAAAESSAEAMGESVAALVGLCNRAQARPESR